MTPYDSHVRNEDYSLVNVLNFKICIVKTDVQQIIPGLPVCVRIHKKHRADIWQVPALGNHITKAQLLP